jgi:hypothetical protein
MTSREDLQRAYIRVCRDSGFKADPLVAAHVVATMFRTSPLEIWIAVGTLETMDQIASGKHPAVLSQ